MKLQSLENNRSGVEPTLEELSFFQPRISRRVVVKGLLGLSSFLAVGCGGPISPQKNTSGLVFYHSDGGMAVMSLAWSPDSRRIVSTTSNRAVQIWDSSTGETLLTYPQRDVRTLGWSPDGEQIASGDGFATIQVWNAATGKRTLTYTAQTPLGDLVWSPDNRSIASTDGTTDISPGEVHVWDVRNGHDSSTFSASPASQIMAISWSPSGKYLACATDDNIISIYNVTTKKLAQFLSVSVAGSSIESIESLAWSPNGTYLAVGGYNPEEDGDTIQIWDVRTGHLLLRYGANFLHAFALSWSPDSQWLASNSEFAPVCLCKVAAKPSFLFYTGQNNLSGVDVVAWSPDGTRIASQTDTGVQVWPVMLAHS